MRVKPILIALCCAVVRLHAESLEQLVDYAVHHHPLLCAGAEHVSLARAEAGEIKANFHPQLHAVGGAQDEQLSVRDDSYLYGYVILRWNLFRGGKDRALLRAANKEQSVRRCELEQQFQSIVRDVATAYYTYLHCQQTASVYKNATDYLTHFDSTAERKRKAGLETAVDGSEIQFHRLHYDALAQKAQAQAGMALADLKLAVGETCEHLQWEIEGDFLTCQPLPQLDAVYTAAFSNRPERAIAEHQRDVHCARLRAAQAEAWPQLDLIGTWGKENEVLADRGVGSRALLVATVPLYQGGRVYHQKCKERAGLRRQQHLAHALDQRITTEVYRAYRYAESVCAHLQAVDKISQERGSFLDTLRDEYQRGVRNSGDVVAGIAFMTEMEIERLDGYRDYSIARTDLAWVMGDVLTIFTEAQQLPEAHSCSSCTEEA